ncbi:MAG: hypothetical protein ABEI75_04770 [Halobaculum sp.]
MTVTRSGGVREQGFADRLRHLAVQANPAFAVGSVVVPLAFVAGAVAVGSTTALFYTHVVAGAVWFGFALLFPAVIGPALGALEDEQAARVTTQLTPKVVFFVFGFSFATVLSGTALLTSGLGLGYGFTGFWPTLALGVGWGLFLFGLVVPNRLHLRAYYEGLDGDPDADRMDRIERRNVVVGLFEAVVMLAVIVVMTGFRLGL